MDKVVEKIGPPQGCVGSAMLFHWNLSNGTRVYVHFSWIPGVIADSISFNKLHAVRLILAT